MPASGTPSSERPRRILLVINPAAGGGRPRRAAGILAALERYNCAVTVLRTTGPGHAEVIAREASVRDFDVIAAAGGDGTVNEIINGLGDKDLALGLAPLGTANVLADEIGLGRTADAIARALALGPIREIHMGRANGRRFTMMAGVGFDAMVVKQVSLRLKKYVGALAYVWESLKQAATYGFAVCDVRIDGAHYQAVSVVACKGRRYGGPFIAAPLAALGEDSFQIILMRGRGAFSVLRYALSLAAGRLTYWRDVEIIGGREVMIGGARVMDPVQAAPVQADGDIITDLPVRITIDPQPLRLIYPV